MPNRHVATQYGSTTSLLGIGMGGTKRIGDVILNSISRDTTKHLLYTILAAALTNGALMRLKLCSHCKKYLVVEDTKKAFLFNSMQG